MQKRLTHSSHPDSDRRLETATKLLRLEPDNDLWGMAALALKIWDIKYSINLHWPAKCHTYKGLFDHAMGELRKAKAKE
jgi:hypothetical protein